MFKFKGLFPWDKFSVCEVVVLLEIGEGVVIDVNEIGWTFRKNNRSG